MEIHLHSPYIFMAWLGIGYVFMAWYLDKHRDNFTFTILNAMEHNKVK
jgi:hypothetical protein